MIEKLDIIRDSENCVDAFGDTHNVAGHKVINKINELVDAVNEIMTWRFETDEEPAENLQDPYGEQRKWIGKVCWFWDNDNTNSSCGILTSIDTETFKEPQFVCNDEYDYEHCEPVKPDDDIIYKGE